MSGSEAGLSRAEQEALAAELASEELARTVPVTAGKPLAILTGGQPGSGKKRVRDARVADFDPDFGAVEIDPDDIRPQIDYMRPLIAAGTQTIPEAANRDAGTVAYLIVQHAKAGHRNLLIDGTLQRTDRAASLATELRAAGYVVELHGLAVHPDLSHARTYARREIEILRSPTRFGRQVDDDFHHQATDGFASTVERFYRERLVDRIVLYDERGAVVLDLSLEHGTWQAEKGSPDRSPVDVLREAHTLQSPAVKQMVADTWALAVELMLDREKRGEDVADDLAKITQHRDRAQAIASLASLSAADDEEEQDRSRGR